MGRGAATAEIVQSTSVTGHYQLTQRQSLAIRGQKQSETSQNQSQTSHGPVRRDTSKSETSQNQSQTSHGQVRV